MKTKFLETKISQKEKRNLSVEIMVKAAKKIKKRIRPRKKKEQTNAYGKRNLRE